MAAPRALAGLALALLTQTALAADVLVLTRDWTPTTCSDASYNCATTFPNTFRVERLALSSDGSPGPLTGCTGKGGLKSKDLDKSALSRDVLGCAWQNATEGLKSLQNSWKVSWGDFGKCTPAENAVDYLELGVQLDQQYPLPNDLPASVDYVQLLDALDRGFGAEAYVTCTSSRQLASIALCFNTSQAGAAPTLTSCPWSAPAGCLGALAVPRNAQGESTCATYFKSSPVSLSGLAAAPGTAPPGQPAAPPAATPSVPPAPTPAAGPSGASSGGAPSPAQAQSPAPAAGGIPSSPSLPPAQAPEPVPGGSDLSAGVTAGSAVPGPSSDSGPSTGVKIGALVAGVAGGVAVGAAALATGWWVYQRKRRRSQAVGSSPSSASPDPEKGVMASSAESLSSWSSSEGAAKRVDSRSSGTSGVAAVAAAAAAALRGAGSRTARAGSGSASPRSAGQRRPESVRSMGSRRSEGGSSARRADSGSGAVAPRLERGSGGSARQLYSYAAGTGSAKFVQPAGPSSTYPGGGSLPASPARSLARSGGSGSGWGAHLDAAAPPGSPSGLRRSVSDAGAAAGGSGSLHRSLSGAPRSPGKAGRFVPATPPKATRYVQPAPPPRSPSSKQGNTHLPSVNE